MYQRFVFVLLPLLMSTSFYAMETFKQQAKAPLEEEWYTHLQENLKKDQSIDDSFDQAFREYCNSSHLCQDEKTRNQFKLVFHLNSLVMRLQKLQKTRDC